MNEEVYIMKIIVTKDNIEGGTKAFEIIKREWKMAIKF